MNQGITNGWAAWYELWSAKTYALNRLREVGNKFRAPELQQAFQSWERFVADLYYARERRDLLRQTGALAGETGSMRTELESLRMEMETKLRAAEDEKRLALQRQLVELTGSAEAQLALREEQDKEARIELVRHQIGRRMLNRDITMAFTAWTDLWTAKVYAMNRLRQVGNRFKSPALLVAFDEWAAACYEATQQRKAAAARAHKAKLEAERGELSGEIGRIKAEYEEKLRKAESARLLLLEKVTLLGGGSAEISELMEAQSALEKEKRVELLRRQIARRMLNQGIIRGWTAWHELWAARVSALKMLRIVGNRFKTPGIALAFDHWVSEWTALRKAAADKKRLAALRGAADGARGEAGSLQEQMEQMQYELKAKLAAAEEDKRRALERLRVELTGTAEELATLNAQKAKEERVELLRRQSMRRMMNRDLSFGWTAWYELWSAKTYAMARLREVGNKFKAPELANAFGFWREDVAETKRQAQLASLELQSKSLEHQLRQARWEAGQKTLIQVANADEINALKEKVTDLAVEVQDRESRLVALRAFEREAESLRLTQQAALDAQALAEEKRQEAEVETLKQREADRDLLEKLLAEQRSQFEDEQASAKKQLAKTAEERKAYEDRITQLSKDLAATATTAASEQKALRDEIEKLKAEITKLKKPPPVKAKKPDEKVKPSPLGKFDIDEGPDAPPISQQLAGALKKNSARVLDLFRSWDADGDGEVSRKEFHRAMPALGLEVPKKDIDDLFSEWDKGGDGSLGLKELQKILGAARTPSKPAEKVQDAASNVMAINSAAAAFKGFGGKKSPGGGGAS